MNRLRSLLALSILAGVACFFVSTGSTSAATINVTTNDVSPVANADGCTLREAIQNINDQAATNTDCDAGDGSDDTIIISAGTITLAANLPLLTENIVIQGAGMGETIIDGDGQWQVFGNPPGSEVDVTISQLRITAFDGAAIVVNDSNLTVSQLDIDGANGITTIQVQGGIGFLNNTSGGTKNLTVEDVYIHDFSGTYEDSVIAGIVAAVDSLGTVNTTIHRVTVENLSNVADDTQIQGFGFASGVFGGFGAGTINATLDNVTISGLNNTDGTGIGGISVISGLNAGSATSNMSLDVTNSTITDISGVESNLFPGRYAAGIAISTAAAQATDTVNVDVNLTNNVLSNLPNSPSENCGVASFAPLFSGVGVENVDITSTGGNLSDDDSCSDYLIHATDRNSVAALAASLSPLADNGGYVPTMALLETSPAVDAGVTVSGLTTDARLAARPQGNAYDSGAYESPYARDLTPTPPEDDGMGLAESGSSLLVTMLAGGGIVFASGYQLLVRHTYRSRS